ncbi:MAG: response regulator transcription factor [Jaaginema sp. PMC 1079.18]|nr:response regulator transcription factor [Jaaginema sp. PMC 1080.18]MEC4850489.1 response regulator transcription factor [Jaaginema sp. PMC 1079.18]MEC4867529.1 response regulator transcription factor [Jaaginema sp. PMC 1078.18]
MVVFPSLSDRSLCVLLIETDRMFRESASIDLQEAGYVPVVVSDIQKGLVQHNQLQPAMVVVDRTLAGESSIDLCRQIRQSGSRTPVLMLMADDSVEDRVACIEAGADDYLVKPYRSETFLELVRLYLQPPTTVNEQLRFGDLVLDLSTRRAFRRDRAIDLTMKEFELLKYLMAHPREVLSREQILENVWGYDFLGESNVIEVYIRYLRLKIEDEGGQRLIQTVRGVGYVLREP